jgi:hypothetical protein
MYKISLSRIIHYQGVSVAFEFNIRVELQGNYFCNVHSLVLLHKFQYFRREYIKFMIRNMQLHMSVG